MLSQTSTELFVRLTVASNDRLGRYIADRRTRRTWRVDFTTPGFRHPEDLSNVADVAASTVSAGFVLAGSIQVGQITINPESGIEHMTTPWYLAAMERRLQAELAAARTCSTETIRRIAADPTTTDLGREVAARVLSERESA